MCALVIALGLSISLINIALMNIVAYEELPFEDGDRFAIPRVANQINSTVPVELWDTYQYTYLKENAQSFSETGAMLPSLAGVISDGETSDRYNTAALTPNLLRITQIQPLLGRSLTEEDELQGAQPVAMISHRVWQNFFNGRQDIIGSLAQINGENRTIVGVMPPGFAYPIVNDIWIPLHLTPNSQPGDESPLLTVAGLLEEGASIRSASEELNNLLDRLVSQYPEHYQSYPADVRPYVLIQNAGTMPLVNTMAGVIVIIILLSCLNLGNLLLVRANERYQELLIRSTVGANRLNLIFPVLLESLLICIIGGSIGLLLTYGGMAFVDNALLNLRGVELPFWVHFDLTGETIALALIIVLFIWLLAGGIPAWKMTRIDIAQGLGSGSKGTAQIGHGKSTTIIVGFELIVSVFLLILCGMLVLNIEAASRADYGVESANRLTARVDLPEANYATDQTRNEYFQNLQIELESIPGVVNTTFATALPGTGGSFTPVRIEDTEFNPEARLPIHRVISVEEQYFQKLGVELVGGRFFDFSDTASSQQVAIVDEVLARHLWPDTYDENPELVIGERFMLDPEENSQWITVVGINSHIIQNSPLSEPQRRTAIYRPFSQRTEPRVNLVIETRENTFDDFLSLQQAASAVDREVPLYRFRNFDLLLTDSMAAIVIVGQIFTVVSLVTLGLAASGIYAIISRTVLQRTHESGVRRALGSTDLNAVLLFVRKGLVYFSIAIAIGGAMATVGSQPLSVLFPQMADYLPIVFPSVTLLFGLIIMSASYLPARRIVAMEPGEALHYE
ncbi:MAG: ABC transporter permease [Pseudomonadales bacterium]|nr:ABC transporter permease [Pseudomonadales bacterium]